MALAHGRYWISLVQRETSLDRFVDFSRIELAHVVNIALFNDVANFLNDSRIILLTTYISFPSSGVMTFLSPLPRSCRRRSLEKSTAFPPGRSEIIFSIASRDKQTSTPHIKKSSPYDMELREDPLLSKSRTDARGKLLQASTQAWQASSASSYIVAVSMCSIIISKDTSCFKSRTKLGIPTKDFYRNDLLAHT